jgi:hypothetical protein
MSFSLPNLILGLISIAIGVWMVVKAYHINHHILFLGWVERKYGPGMGTTAYQLLGTGFILFGCFVALGFVDLFGAAFPARETEVAPTRFQSNTRESTRIAD